MQTEHIMYIVTFVDVKKFPSLGGGGGGGELTHHRPKQKKMLTYTLSTNIGILTVESPLLFDPIIFS